MKPFLKRHGRVILMVAGGLIATAVVVLAILATEGIGPFAPARADVSQTDFLARLDAGQIASARIEGSAVEFVTKDGTEGRTTILWTDTLRATIARPGLDLEVSDSNGKPFSGPNAVLDLILKLNMVGFLVLTLVFMAGYVRSPVKKQAQARSSVRFSDVAGMDEARGEVSELVDYLKNPGRYSGLGAAIPKGVLLVGPPGTGKTLLARAVAGEAGVPFFAATGSDFVEMYVGVGAARIRRLFKDARKHAPCILFIDEIDALARARGATAPSGGQIETENTLNQLLSEMDGFARSSGLIVMAATNRVDILDPAILRPGRFDRHIHVGLPDIRGREAILGVHAARLQLGPDVALSTIARGTPGMSGAELANLVNEAALCAARAGRAEVVRGDFETARDRIVMGGEKPTLMSEDERRLTAYHEAGHAVVALHSRHSDPIHKVTIVPRGRALGMMVRLPEQDRFCHSKARLLAELDVAMGGRAAEELVFGPDHVTTGAAGDIQAATDMATRMVTAYGMSETFGLVALGSPDAATGHGLAPRLAGEIAIEVRGLIEAAYGRAKATLAAHRPALHALAEALLEHETLDAEAVRRIAAEAVQPACAAAE